MLTDDGLFIASVPNGDSAFGLVNQNGDLTHCVSYGQNSIVQLAHMCKCELVNMHSDINPLFGRGFLYFLHRVISAPLKLIVNLVMILVYMPKTNVKYTSKNILFALRNRPDIETQ